MEKWSFLALFTFLNIFGRLGHYWPKFGQNRPNPILQRHYCIILFNIHSQGLKLCGKVVLFASLGFLVWFWHFDPILDLQGPKSPKELQEPKLFCCPLDFTYPWVFENALSFVGIHSLIFDLG